MRSGNFANKRPPSRAPSWTGPAAGDADGVACCSGVELAWAEGAGPDRSSSAPNAPRAAIAAAIKNRSSIAATNTWT